MHLHVLNGGQNEGPIFCHRVPGLCESGETGHMRPFCNWLFHIEADTIRLKRIWVHVDWALVQGERRDDPPGAKVIILEGARGLPKITRMPGQ